MFKNPSHNIGTRAKDVKHSRTANLKHSTPIGPSSPYPPWSLKTQLPRDKSQPPPLQINPQHSHIKSTRPSLHFPLEATSLFFFNLTPYTGRTSRTVSQYTLCMRISGARGRDSSTCMLMRPALHSLPARKYNLGGTRTIASLARVFCERVLQSEEVRGGCEDYRRFCLYI